ncbi:class I SAM-dependent methyltransferase [Streptomyces sp. NPDC086554]|uniref:class I SAM-dependent methyltransferase n=1 Tax=Streptomyces sp. NPDC086554 TaxID=3154864 RepID=UPI003412089A
MTMYTTGTEWQRAVESARTIYDISPLYEAIYLGRGKDYEAEAGTVAELVRARNPEARDLLDVGCGPGNHLQYFAAAFDHVEGADLADAQLASARSRLPDVPVHRADMRTFDLGRQFSAVTCLFSAIGNISGTDELRAAVRSMARHLRPGGVLVIEPWWFPETFTAGHIGSDTFEHEGTTISRVSHSVRRGDSSHMEVHYVFARPGEGIWHFADEHTMALFPRTEYETAFADAGLKAEFLDLGNSGPGVFVGTLESGTLESGTLEGSSRDGRS